MQPFCIYCRKARVVHYQYSNRFFRSENFCRSGRGESVLSDIFKCPACGLLYTQAELDKDTENRKIYSGSVNGSLPENKQAEEQALSAAWEKMLASRWDEAFNESFPPGCALTQPPVFMFYRAICQTAPLLMCPAEDLNKRYLHINMLLNNIKCLNFYLEGDNNSEADYMIFKRLTDAFLLLGSLPVRRHKHIFKERHRVRNTFIYYTNFMRASVLASLAEILEMSTISSRKYACAYMKMDVQLLHKCLESTQEKKSFCLTTTVISTSPRKNGGKSRTKSNSSTPISALWTLILHRQSRCPLPKCTLGFRLISWTTRYYHYRC